MESQEWCSIELHPSAERLSLVVRDRHVALTLTESRLMAALLEAHGGILTRRELGVCASPEAPLSHACLQVHVAHMRRKLAAEAARLVTHRGLGYSFRSGPLGGFSEPGSGP